MRQQLQVDGAAKVDEHEAARLAVLRLAAATTLLALRAGRGRRQAEAAGRRRDVHRHQQVVRLDVGVQHAAAVQLLGDAQQLRREPHGQRLVHDLARVCALHQLKERAR